ncbi:type VI secretion system-associated FHA domain protein TagH [Paraburkholderia lacunae]|uniref:Type VI secretion system-associated FHA domain protein TagH n=1 Tax=Paraburkholderia lacunae TaxID=2211104 RepID=A0A370NA30_9BURK|nr:type VI secretion system-associated FHA domain protein TagH [Paraburkholderia lacunae]RDK02447.1 type VI secretion system-associated FHA domain protein TagH [Paraburkholderia lacunae]
MFLILRVEHYRNAAAPAAIERKFGVDGGTIGRSTDNDLVLPDPDKLISRAHARIEFRDGSFLIQDVGSNPSVLNGRPLGGSRQARLTHGDDLAVGEYLLSVVVQAEAPVAAPSPAAARNGLDDLLGSGGGLPLPDPLALPPGLDALQIGSGPADDPLGLNGPLNSHAGPLADALFERPSLERTPGYSGSMGAQAAPESLPFTGASMGIPTDYDPFADLGQGGRGGRGSHDGVAASPQQAQVRVHAQAVSEAPVAAPAPVLLPEFTIFGRSEPGPATPVPAASASPAPWPVTRDDRADSLSAGLQNERAGTPPVITRPGPVRPMPDVTLAEVPAQPAVFAQGAHAALPPVSARVEHAAASLAVAHAAPTQAMQALAAIPASHVQAAPAEAVQATPAARPNPTTQPAPASASAPAPASASASAPTQDAILQALLKGLGVPDLPLGSRSAVDLAELVGQMLRESLGGTIDVLMARALTKKEIRIDMTVIGVRDNNPLKFFPDVDSALMQMLSGRGVGYLPPLKAIWASFDDIKAHELAMVAGMRAALLDVLKRFDPAAIEKRIAAPTVMDKMLGGNRKARLWDRQVEMYDEMVREADDDFQRLFGERFASAYEDQIGRIRSK